MKLEADWNTEVKSFPLYSQSLNLNILIKAVDTSQIFAKSSPVLCISDKSFYSKELSLSIFFKQEFYTAVSCFSSQALGKWELIPAKWIVKYANIVVVGKPWKLIRKLQLMDFTSMWQKADYRG